MKVVTQTLMLSFALLCSSQAFADRALTGVEAQRLLAGKRFNLQCVDGTRGFGTISGSGVINVSYKRSASREDAMEERDRATVRPQGNEICLSWKQFAGGGDSCYPVAEVSNGRYRIGVDGLHCDIDAR